MDLEVANLKESNKFLNLLFDNLTSVILLANAELKINHVNSTFEVLFNKKNEDIFGQLCGEGLGCSYVVEENVRCGCTTKCKNCIIRKKILDTFNRKADNLRNSLSKEFYINNQKIEKHLQFSSRYVSLNGVPYVLLIVDDVTEIVRINNDIKKKNQEIEGSIQYAKNIQTSILPSPHVLPQWFKEYFLIFKPKDIVSGDFYWFFQNEDIIYCAVADCTGHGVPGALMSTLGISLLNRIIFEKGSFSPSQILNALRDLIVEILKQKGDGFGNQDGVQVQDGMDIVLIAFNRKTLACQFAGANNSLYWIRAQEVGAGLEEIKPDRMPVSIYLKMDPFTNHTLQLQKGDILYLKTDGFEDQYSSVTGKKLLRKKLKDLLVDIYPYPLAHQEEILNAAFEVWKGDAPQTDDITLLGLKI